MKHESLWFEFRNAVYFRDFSHAEELLRQNPDLISMENGIGETALQFLAVENDMEGVAWLFSKGGNLNCRNKFGEPAIFEVAQLGYKELFFWLLDNGADPNVKGREGESILDFLNHSEKRKLLSGCNSMYQRH